jgi:hypothetical protein
MPPAWTGSKELPGCDTPSEGHDVVMQAAEQSAQPEFSVTMLLLSSPLALMERLKFQEHLWSGRAASRLRGQGNAQGLAL